MRTVKANINNIKGPLNRYFSRCIGAGRAAEVMRREAYEQLKMIQKECPFEYIRFHGLFHDEMGIVNRRDDGSLFFNFQYVDMLFDSLLDISIRPVVELGLMPGELRSGDESVFWWKMYKMPPRDYGEWSLLITALVQHFTERYGREEVKKWFFEVWNEPDIESFLRSDDRMNDYFKIYESAARAVKSVDLEYKVGGPATAGLRWISDMMTFCETNNVPLDFISGHYYCVKGAFDPDGKTVLYMFDHEYYTGKVNAVGKQCRESGYPLLVTEWSASYSSRDAVHDSYFSAPFILHCVKACEGNADMMSYWVYSDIFEEVGIGQTPFHGGFGLINMQSIPKPSFYAYKMLNSLGDTELFCDDRNAYVCKSESEVQVLVWNSVIPEQDAHNNVYFARPLPALNLEDAAIEICGLKPEKKYKIKIETVGYKMGDAYNAYLELGDEQLSLKDSSRKIIEASRPNASEMTLSADCDGILRFKIPQSENQADLIRIDL